MSTPHNRAEKGDIAKNVLLSGDPLRAKYIAEHYLDKPVLYNDIRGMLGYTGTFEGVPVSVQGSGMGIPSIAIYSYELYHFYDVENIFRVGTCGAISTKVKLGDIVIAEGSSTDSNYCNQFHAPGQISGIADYTLLEAAVAKARKQGVRFHVGNVASGDTFYEETDTLGGWQKMGILAGEMESYGLYLNAQRAGKKALAMFTVSDEMYSGKHASAKERQTGYTDMMEIALHTACDLN